MLNKVQQLSYTNFISSLAILRYSYPLVFRIVVIPALVVVLPLEDKERWDKLATSTNSSNQSNLLIIRLANRVMVPYLGYWLGTGRTGHAVGLG
jgi:hypothetical protein